MSRIAKTFALLLTITIAVSFLTLLTVKPTNAQTIPTPSVPEFTLQFVGQPYDSLFITVKNQPYNHPYTLYYNVRLKDHNADNDSWRYPLDHLFQMFDTYPTQSTYPDYTNVSLSVQSGC